MNCLQCKCNTKNVLIQIKFVFVKSFIVSLNTNTVSIESTDAIIIFVSLTRSMAKRKMNRIKAELAERDISHKTLAEDLGKDPNTVTRWCNNVSQPNMHTLYRIAIILDCEVYDLLRPVSQVFPEEK